MARRRRIIHADKILQNVIQTFCLLMFLQLKGFYLEASNPMLLYSTAADIRLTNISKPNKINAIIKGLEQGSAVDFLYRTNLICWSDQTTEPKQTNIQCTKYNGTNVGEKMKIVSEGLNTPTGMAIDWYTEKLYWTDGETNRIEVISLGLKHRKVLFWSEVDLARAIAVVPMEALIFWTDWGDVPKIECAGMNGDPSTRKVLVKDNIIWPNGITVDHNAKLVYWVDAKLQFVDVVDFNGNNRRNIVKGGLDYPYALTMFNNKLYWTDWKTWAIHTYDMSTNGPIKELIRSDPVPVDIRVYDPSRQTTPQDYPCRLNNGGCSHLCLLSPNPPGYICTCPTGVKLIDGSNTTCHNGSQSMLLVAQRSTISKISLDSPDFTPYTIPLKDVKRAISVDFDPRTEYFYWADNISKTISRARIDGTEQMTIIHVNIGYPDSIAIDDIARNIYWTDPSSDTISVARLDGSYKKVIIHDDLYEPRAIALHPKGGWMFWSDWSEKKPKIERANLDGTGRVLLISENVAWPNGLALDTSNSKLYWGDARTHKIEVCNLDGTGRRELHSNDIFHIFGLTLLGEHLYWTDMQRRTLDRINKFTGGERQPVVEQMANMMGVKAFRLGENSGSNPCAGDNAGCSHLCFNRPHDYICGCPLGLELGSDRKTCMEPQAFLVYSRKNVIGIISIENQNNDVTLPLKESKEVSALAVHVSGSQIYWADSKTKTINRCSVNECQMEKIVEWTGVVEGLAVDWSGQNIYWTDNTAQKIEVARLDGSSRRTLIWQGLKKPKSIALDPKKGFMYWSELGSKTIKRAAMDGSFPGVLLDQVGRVNSLAIDFEKRAIYWAALEPSAIETAQLDGSGRRKLLTDNLPIPYALALYSDKLFWGDWSTGDIEVILKSDGSSRAKITSHLDLISDLKVYHRGRRSGGNQCAVDNGGCAHLCLATPTDAGRADFHCACPTHHTLQRDNYTCSEPDEFFLFAQKNTISRIMVTNGECSDAVIPLTGLKNVKAIEYDPVKKLLYWMEEDSHTIRRVAISYSSTSTLESTVVVNDLSRPFHMVLDILGRAIYWTCTHRDSINATTIDTNSSYGVIIKLDRMMPRHLAFHQTERYLVWNDIGLGAIMRANVDGSDTLQLARVSNATALAVDQHSHTVYWAMNRQIYAIELDGTNKRTVWQGGWSGSVAVGGGWVYVSGTGGPVRIQVSVRDSPAAPVGHGGGRGALLAVSPPPRSHVCWGGGGCGAGPGRCGPGGACGCGAACERRVSCQGGQFPCLSPPTTCIPRAWRCDGQIDCPDGSDEHVQECGICPTGVRCVDGSCVESLGACLNGALCAGTTTLPDAFKCDERLCLSPSLLCDGHRHCESGADEAPTACAYKTSGSSSGASWAAVGGVGGVACAAVAAWAVVSRCRRPPPVDPAAHRLYGRPRPPAPRPYPTGPPPSPATSAGRRRAYRHYRAINRPPPPTPASTDAAESDAAPAPPPTPLPPSSSPSSPSSPSFPPSSDRYSHF